MDFRRGEGGEGCGEDDTEAGLEFGVGGKGVGFYLVVDGV